MVGLALLWGLYGAFTGVFDEVVGMGYDRSGTWMCMCRGTADDRVCVYPGLLDKARRVSVSSF